MSLVALAAGAVVAAKLSSRDVHVLVAIAIDLTILSGLATVVATVWEETGRKKAVNGFLAALAVGALAVIVSIHGALPFGALAFTDSSSPTSLLPTGLRMAWFAPLSWLLICSSAFLFVCKVMRPKSVIAGAVLAGLLVAFLEFSTEPSMVKSLQYWEWTNVELPIGQVLGYPVINVVGWFLTASVAGFVLSSFKAEEARSHEAGVVLWSYLALLLLPTALDRHVFALVLVPIYAALSIWSVVASRSTASA